MTTISLEVWRATYTDSEDLARKPIRVCLIAGDDGPDCMQQAMKREDDLNGRAVPPPNGGAYILHNLTYIGGVDVEVDVDGG